VGIELFRGLAACMVLLTHYARFFDGAPAGLGFLWTGVDLFFVISGFVFAPLLLGKTSDGGPAVAAKLAVDAFFIRRLFRIYPLYLLALCAYALSQPAAADKTATFLRHLLFLHTTRSYEEAYYFNPAFWSLPVEIEFYLAVPLLALLAGRRIWLQLVFGLTLVLSLVANYRVGPVVDGWRLLSVHLPSILPEFLAGTLLWDQVMKGRAAGLHWRSSPALTALVAGLLLLGTGYLVKYGIPGLESSRLLEAPFNFLCACGYALLMYPVLLVPDQAWRPALAWCAGLAGACSYGIYLFHNLLPLWLQQAGMQPRGALFFWTAALGTVALAYMLYQIYENPLRRFGRQISRRRLATLGAASSLPDSK